MGKTFTLNNSISKAISPYSYYIESGAYVQGYYTPNGSVAAGTTVSITSSSTPKIIMMVLSGDTKLSNNATQYANGIYNAYILIPSLYSSFTYAQEKRDSYYTSPISYTPPSSISLPLNLMVSTSTYNNLFIDGHTIVDCSAGISTNPIFSISGNTVTATFSVGAMIYGGNGGLECVLENNKIQLAIYV